MTRTGITEKLHYTSDNPKWISEGKEGMKLVESKGDSKRDLVLIHNPSHFGGKTASMKNVDRKVLLKLLGYLPEDYTKNQIGQVSH